MLPHRKDQVVRIREAFGRDMIPDDSQLAEDGVIFVKSADGSPPGPELERIMTYTFGGDTPTTIREGLKSLHPGKNPAEMTFEDAEMNEDDPVGDWLSCTGKSFFKVNWKMAKEYQKFWLWTPDGEKDLADEEWDGRSPDEMWLSLRHKNNGSEELREFRLFEGQRELS
jgi:hypothetical protein